MNPYSVGGLTGGRVEVGTPAVRPQPGEGQAVSRTQPLRIANGTLIEGLVVAQDDDLYQVRIGRQSLQARASIPLFVGQRFRAVWDSSQTPPVLRLQQSDLAVAARFTGRDQQIALALLGRGLPVKEDVIWNLRQAWMQLEGDPSKLGTLVELWARGAALTPQNMELMGWYMQLTSKEAAAYWKKIRDTMKKNRNASPKELLRQLKNREDPDQVRFLNAHALAGKPLREGVDPSMLLAPAWWPVGEETSPLTARVAVSTGTADARTAWWAVFDMEGEQIGCVNGDAMTNGQALSVNLRLESVEKTQVIQDNLETLRQDLSSLPLTLQHIGVGLLRRKQGGSGQGLDMEA